MYESIILGFLLFLPATLGFLGCVFPKTIFPLSITALLAYALSSLYALNYDLNYAFTLVGDGGIQFSIDGYSFPLIFGSSITLLIVFGLFKQRFSHYYYQVCLVLLTALFVSFTTIDLISLFIALELLGFSAFLLIADRNDKKSLFLSFQYLIGGGLAMLIYLIGVIQAFTFTGTFLIEDLVKAPNTALCLIVAGLLTKAGVFICGLWVPNVYSHANSQSAAILSGCVTCSAIAPIERMSETLTPIGETLGVLGVLSAVVAAIYAVFERESGRALGLSSVSQLGIAILSPTFGCLYAMQHGICKTLLFSTLRNHVASGSTTDGELYNKISDQQETTREILRVITFVVASLSIMGFPFLAGFMTKAWIKNDLVDTAKIIFTTSALLTSTVYARLIFERIQNLRLNYDLKRYWTNLRVMDFVNTLISSSQSIILTISITVLVLVSVSGGELYTTYNIRSAILSALLGGILFTSVVGIQADEWVKPVTKTLDLVGAPFLVAALLLANLLYFKI